MPTYEYKCQDCGHTVEVVQSFSDAPLTVCEVCGGRLRRVFHPVGIVLKGSGFYSTDNRQGKRTGAAKPSKDSGSDGGSAAAEKSAEKTSDKADSTKTSTSSEGSSSSGSSKKKPAGEKAS